MTDDHVRIGARGGTVPAGTAKLIVLLLLLAAARSGSTQTVALNPGYVICESGGQLRWFTDIDRMSDLWAPHPEPWRVPIRIGEGPNKWEQLRALGRLRHLAIYADQKPWCLVTDGLDAFTVRVLEDCTEALPLPNGGCRKIEVSTADGKRRTTWYTFGDALERVPRPDG